MTPAFGFSVGDFISTIHLIRKIRKALKETGGASSEYQDAVLELNGLKHALQHVQALKPTGDNQGHVNAIRGMALACCLPLQEFLKALEKYEGSLGPWPRRNPVGNFGRKTKWAVSFGKEVEKLRAIVGAKQISINLLLALHSSQTLSSLNHRTKQEYTASKARDEEHRAALDQVSSTAQNLKDTMDSTAVETKASLQTLSNRFDSSNTSIASLTTIWDQILAFVKTFPQEVRERLQAITQADWRTYQAVLRLQESISRAPTSLHESNIHFTNALGDHTSLPYEHFCHWEPFEGHLRAQFKNRPGETKVLNGSFHIIDSKRGSIVRKDHWHRNISQGIQLKMSMVMLHLRTSSGKCPQPDCAGFGRFSSNDSPQMVCDTCSLAFFSETSELEDAFGRVKVSDEAVTRQQVEEDMRLYGTRPEPSDGSIYDIDENIRRTKPLSKQDAQHVEGTIGRPAKMPGLFEEAGPENQVLTAMDWHSGASPLEAWLNQSAIPTVAATRDDNERTTSVELQIAQEIEEIKNFRSVHLTAVQQPNSLNGNLHSDKDFASLRYGAQFYYRNIKDKFPLIPTYLARRLAEANLDRAAALQTRRHARDGVRPPLLGDESSPQTKPVSDGFWHGGSPSRRPSSAASIHSRSSSMNSSLHESAEPDLYQQNEFELLFPSSSARGLPAPPVDLVKHKQFDCDLCGEAVHVEKRQQWQSHVMSDLRPYQCTFEDCTQGDKTYASCAVFIVHESLRHDWHNSSCPFCQETVSANDRRGRGRHLGRHMEEIAFAVVHKAYEDWEFYSDSSKDIS